MNDLQYFMDEANKYYEAGMRHKDIPIKDVGAETTASVFAENYTRM